MALRQEFYGAIIGNTSRYIRERRKIMYHIGDVIIYGEHGICRVEEMGPLKLGGTKERLYYTLRPYHQPELVIYAPVDNVRVVVRSPLTREQAEQLVTELPQIPAIEIADEKNRETLFAQIQHSCDCRALVGLIKALYLRRSRREKEGKHATSVDERYFHSAEDQLCGELAYALGIEREKIPEYIHSRMGTDVPQE